MIKKILLMLVIAVGFSAAAYAGPREEVITMVETMHGMCPKDLGDGLTVNEVIMEGDNVIMILAMPIAPEMMAQMEPMLPMLGDEMLKGMKGGDPELVKFISNIKAMGGNFIISITSTQGECTPLVIAFKNSEL